MLLTIAAKGSSASYSQSVLSGGTNQAHDTQPIHCCFPYAAHHFCKAQQSWLVESPHGGTYQAHNTQPFVLLSAICRSPFQQSAVVPAIPKSVPSGGTYQAHNTSVLSAAHHFSKAQQCWLVELPHGGTYQAHDNQPIKLLSAKRCSPF
jgi:hypothetical protein